LIKNTYYTKNHAIALIVLAIEELGKAKVLSERLQMAKKKGVDIIEVKESLFEKHPEKFKEGCSLIPSSALVLEEAAFQANAFQPNAFQTNNVEVNPEIRLEATFVDWDDVRKAWKIGVPVASEKIESLICHIQNALKKI